MAIGFFRRRRAVLLAAALAPLLLVRGDEIAKKDGSVVDGQITGVDGDQAKIESTTASGGRVLLSVYLSDVKSVQMAAPAAIGDLASAAPAQVISTLEPLVNQYAGLPADWVVDAMAKLASAYDAAGQADKSAALLDRIGQLYPGSRYTILAAAGKAKLALGAGRIDEALADVQPLIDAANKDLAPAPDDARAYAGAFLVYGRILEAQNKLPEALEAYLTVKTMLYQNPELAQEADQRAQALRQKNADLGVE
jgi:tetratricopeptide (TPR) repeat protein